MRLSAAGVALLAAVPILAPGQKPSADDPRTSLQLTHKGGWAPWSRTPDVDTRREVGFELHNPASSNPSYSGPFLIRWQVRCQSPASPFVSVFAEDHAGRYPGGPLPAPGTRLPFKIVFETTRMKSPGVYAGWSAEPYELPVHCRLHVGPFVRGQAPQLPGRSPDDDSPAPGTRPWQSEEFLVTIRNDDSMAKPPDVSIDSLALAGDESGRDPLEGGREFWAILGMVQNSGIAAISYECELARDGTRVKVAPGVVGFGAVEKGKRAVGRGAVGFGPQPKGDYEARCRTTGVPSHLNTEPSNDTRSLRRVVTVEIKGPGPDLRINLVDVRDAARLSSITPTAGNAVRTHLMLDNRGTEDLGRDAKVVCTASRGGRILGRGDAWIEAPFRKSSERRVAVNLPALEAATDLAMLCAVDAAGDPDLSNNLKRVSFAVEPARSTDFRIHFESRGGWTEWTGTPGVNTRRQTSIDFYNPSRRGPAVPGYAAPMELRWQASCVCANSPFVHVFAHDHIQRHPGGPLPAPGPRQTIAIGLETTRPDPKTPGVYAGFRAEPRTLQIQCTLRTGLFLKGSHPGGGAKSEHDYSIAPGQRSWWTAVVQFRLTNSDGR